MSNIVSLADRLADTVVLQDACDEAAITTAQARRFCAALAKLNVNQLARIVIVSYDEHVRQINRETRTRR